MIRLLRLLNGQGIAGLVLAISLAGFLVAGKIESKRWERSATDLKRRLDESEQERTTLIADIGVATERARAADAAYAARIRTAQQAINDRSKHDFDTRIADARARAQRLRDVAQVPGGDRAVQRADVPRLPPAAGRIDETTDENRLPPADRLIATEQSIQLDELIRWVREQATIRQSER